MKYHISRRLNFFWSGTSIKAGLSFLIALLLSSTLALPAYAKTPNDPYALGQWYMKKIDAEGAWDRSTGSDDVVVAVIDGPMDINHSDLKNNIWKNPGEIRDGKDNDGNGLIDDINGWDYIHMDPDPTPDTGSTADALSMNHATMVAGIIGAEGNNRISMAGVNWDVQIMSLQALDEKGSGLVSNVIHAIRYAIDKKVDVINLSFVGEGYDASFKRVLKEAYDAGIVVVAAAGNDNDGLGEGNLNVRRKYPVCYDSDEDIPFIVGVASLKKSDEVSFFSNYGSGCVDISAPGSSVGSLGVHAPEDGFNGQFVTGYSGTSVAAPFVSGTAALLRAAYPDLTVADIISVLKDSSVSVENKNTLPRGSLGSGRLNAAAALKLAGELEGSNRGAEFVVMFDGGQWTNIRHFSHDYKKQTQFVVPVPFDQIVALEIIDVNRDGVQEVVFAYVDDRTHVVAYSLEGYKIFESDVSDAPVRTVGLSAGDVIRDGKGGLVVAFPEQNKLKVILYKSNGDIFHFFEGAALESNLESVAVRFSDTGFIYGMAHYGTHVDRWQWNFIGAFVTRDRFDVPDGTNRPVAMNGAGTIVAFGAAQGRASAVTVLQEGQTAAQSFTPFGSFMGGSSITLIDWDRDGKQEVVVGAGPGGGPHVRVFALNGVFEGEFFAHGPQYDRGIFARAFNR